jgi:hypothetical protein
LDSRVLFRFLFFCELLRPPEWVVFPPERFSRSGVLRMLFRGVPLGRATLLLLSVLKVLLGGCGAIGVPFG